jgi:N-methylhydantoinase B
VYIVKPQDADFVQHPDDVYELWCCSGGGWGDPLDREPDAVARDVREGYCSRAAAEQVYATVVNASGEVDTAATERQLADTRARRVGKATGELTPPREDDHREDRLMTVGEYLDVVSGADGEARFECRKCSFDMGPTTENYKDRCVVHDRDIQELGRYFHDPTYFIDDPVCARDHYCPGCGTLMQVDVVRRSDPLLVDVKLTPTGTGTPAS